jgi:hypothetical protein
MSGFDTIFIDAERKTVSVMNFKDFSQLSAALGGRVESVRLDDFGHHLYMDEGGRLKNLKHGFRLGRLEVFGHGVVVKVDKRGSLVNVKLDEDGILLGTPVLETCEKLVKFMRMKKAPIPEPQIFFAE